MYFSDDMFTSEIVVPKERGSRFEDELDCKGNIHANQQLTR